MTNLLQEHQGKPYRIRVSHHRERDENGKALPRGGVTVVVFEDENRAPVAAAQAFCSPKDNFCRRTGRNVAIGRVIKLLEGED